MRIRLFQTNLVHSGGTATQGLDQRTHNLKQLPAALSFVAGKLLGAR